MMSCFSCESKVASEHDMKAYMGINPLNAELNPICQ